MFWNWPGKHRHDLVLKGLKVYGKLLEQNTSDLRLYEYVEQLFKSQGKWISKMKCRLSLLLL